MIIIYVLFRAITLLCWQNWCSLWTYRSILYTFLITTHCTSLVTSDEVTIVYLPSFISTYQLQIGASFMVWSHSSFNSSWVVNFSLANLLSYCWMWVCSEYSDIHTFMVFEFKNDVHCHFKLCSPISFKKIRIRI